MKMPPATQLRATAAAAAITARLADAPDEAQAHTLPPGTWGSEAYSRALTAKTGWKAVFQAANIESAVVAGKELNHLLLVQLMNWLNGFQFSEPADPANLHTIVATYASANLLTYNDAVWAKYRLGEKYNIVDPTTGEKATRNVFWPSRFGLSASRDIDNPQSFWRDPGIEALQQRGTVFLT